MLSLSPSVFAQKNSADSVSQNSKWIISFLGASNYVYRSVHNITQKNDSQINPSWSYNTSDQISKYAYHASLLVSRKINPNIYFQTGLFLDKKGYKSKSFSDTVIHPSWSGTFYDITNQTIDYNFTSIGIPLFVNCNKKIYKKLYFEATLGISINFVQRVRVEYIGSDFSINPEITGGQIKQWQYMLYSKIGIFYKYREDAYISLSPAYSYLLTSYHDPYSRDGANKDLNLYSMGIELGIHFCIDKK